MAKRNPQTYSVGTRSLTIRSLTCLEKNEQSGTGENGVASSPIIDLQDEAQTQVPLPAESVGPVAEPSDRRAPGVTGAAPSPLATARGEQPQQALPRDVRETKGLQGVLSEQANKANFRSSLLESQGEAASGDTIDIDVGGEVVSDGAAMTMVSPESREEYVS